MSDTEGPYQLWPDQAQRLLLQIALGRSPDNCGDFDQWQQLVHIEAELSWNSVRLLPLVYTALSKSECTAPLVQRLKGVHRKAWFENNRLFHATAPLLAALREQHIDVLLLKGAPMALGYYETPAHRPMSDLDILVHPEQLERTVAKLQEFGWKVLGSIEPEMRRIRHAAQCVRDDGIEIDLHWGVLIESADATESFWQRATPFDFQGVPVLQLAPADALLHAVLHGVRCNPDPPIRWIPDALAILERKGAEIDWPAVIAFASRHRMAHRFALGMLHLVREYGAEIPPPVLKQLEQVKPTLVERLENTVLLSDYSAYTNSPIGNSWVLFTEYLRIVDTWNPVRLVNDISHFVRIRWELNGRREIMPRIARGVWRRVAR